jgi:hypothetical protein
MWEHSFVSFLFSVHNLLGTFFPHLHIWCSQTLVIYTIFFFIYLVKVYTAQWPPLWSSGQSYWLQIRRPGFDSRHYQKKKVVGLERGPLSHVSTIEELLDRKSSGSCLQSQEYGHRDSSHWPRDTLYLQNLALTSPTIGGRSVGIVRLRTQATEFSLVYHLTCIKAGAIRLTLRRKLYEVQLNRWSSVSVTLPRLLHSVALLWQTNVTVLFYLDICK